jgi:DNA-directed RNA polymerase subunit N (RpoN/RPB10)
MLPEVQCYGCGRILADEYANFLEHLIQLLEQDGENAERASLHVPQSGMMYCQPSASRDIIEGRSSVYKRAMDAAGLDYSHRQCCLLHFMTGMNYAHRISRDSAGTATWPKIF